MGRQRWAFVLYLWVESGPGAGGRAALRGSLQLVGTETVRYFTSVEQVADLLVDAMGAFEPPENDPHES